MESFILKLVSSKNISQSFNRESPCSVVAIREGPVQFSGLNLGMRKQKDIFVKRVYVLDSSNPGHTFYSKVGWVINHGQPHCLICCTRFGWINRKHHCRACGNLVCDHCSQGRMFIENLDKWGKVRICKGMKCNKYLFTYVIRML